MPCIVTKWYRDKNGNSRIRLTSFDVLASNGKKDAFLDYDLSMDIEGNLVKAAEDYAAKMQWFDRVSAYLPGESCIMVHIFKV